PVIFMGIFSKRMNREGAIVGMITGLVFTSSYIIYFKFINLSANSPENWWFGISPEGFGTVAMITNFIISLIVSRFTPEPPSKVREIVENIRIPSGVNEAQYH
ncbi:MAG: cation acetate symporter, partial [Polaribacter sp.]|nr:cation acetate symporter [Polaribacter sp.]